MTTIGRYLLLIISLSGITLADDDRFSEEDVVKFLDYIFRLHNAVRIKHGVPTLERTDEMDVIASQKLNELMNNTEDEDDPLGVIFNWICYDNTTQLNIEEAKKWFSLSYEQGNFYDYELYESVYYADDFTQIVWQETTQIGITFRIKENKYLVLAVYYPQGNVVDNYALNVNRPINGLLAADDDIGLIYKTEKEKFIDKILELHNEARINHGVSELDHDDELDVIANSMLQHEENMPTEEHGVNWIVIRYFENIKLKEDAAYEAFSTWYNGKKTYHQKNKPPNSFTQIVWRNTRQIGIGIKEKFGNEYEILVVYKPRGNIPG